MTAAVVVGSTCTTPSDGGENVGLKPDPRMRVALLSRQAGASR